MPRTPFGELIRELRISRRLTQKQVAEGAGMRPGTYGNAESAEHKVCSLARVHAIARFYGLPDDEHEKLVALWRDVPESQYAKQRREKFAKQNGVRERSRRYGRLYEAVVDFLCSIPWFTDQWLPAQQCSCSFERTCDLCRLLETIGCDSYTDPEKLQDQLQKLVDEIDAGRAANNAQKG